MNNLPIMLITGTRTGIGNHLAKYYLNKGFKVIGCSRDETDLQNDNYHHFLLDVADEASIKTMFNTIRKQFGYLNYLINNAGITSMNHAILTPLKEVHEVFNTNFSGTFLCCREAVKLMQRKKFGRIINLSSIHTQLSIHGTSIYGGSKAAVEKFSDILAKEVFQFGITVNVLSLSVIEGSGMADNLPNETRKQILEKTASKALLNIGDVSHAIDFLIDDNSKAITGQNISVG